MNVTIIPVGILGTNCYLLASEQQNCVVIDPGAQPEKLIRAIKDAGLTPQYILLTHGHHDHIGGVRQLMREYTLELFIGEGDLELLTDAEKNRAAFRHDNTDEFLIENAGTLTDGQVLELDELQIQVITTPGHTKGGVTFQCRDCLFTGDTLFRDDVGRCDLYGGDYPTMKQSLAKLTALEGDYTVYPGHGPSSTLDYERQNNRYINE